MRLREHRKAVVRAIAALAATICGAGAMIAPGAANAAAFPHYNHVFLMVEENHNYEQIIGNPAAPVINALASDYGSATNYRGVADPSEPSYVAMLGGSAFGIEDDEPYFWPGHTINAQNLMSQIEGAGLSWAGYYQGMNYSGYRGYCFPAKCNGIPDSDTQYVAKHNGVVNFEDMHTPQNYAKQHPYRDLASALQSGEVANFNYIVPDECHDMHGAPPWCLDSNEPATVEDNYLVSTGDAFVRETIDEITSSPVWEQGTNAIVLTFDEGEFATDQIPAIVITNHGPRGVTDATPYNHYSLLRSVEEAFGLGCLLESCAATPMTRLFEVTGSNTTPALPAAVAPDPDGTNTVSPTGPAAKGKPVSLTAGEEWQVVPSPNIDTLQNTLAGVSATSATNAWAVGAYYPPGNPEVLSALGLHWDGKRWTAYPLPNVGPNENSLLSVSEVPGGKTWAVGYYASAEYQQRTLIEYYDGSSWQVIPSPDPGAAGNILYGVKALSNTDVWAIGGQREASGLWRPLAEHWNGSTWSVVPVPDPGNADVLLYALSATTPGNVWAVGQTGKAFPQETLLEHYDGSKWATVKTQQDPTESLDPFGLDAHRSEVTIVGARETDVVPYTTMVASGPGSAVTLDSTPSAGTGENDLFGAATAADGSTWAVGWYVEAATQFHRTLVEHGVGGNWSLVESPNPSAEENGFSSVTAIPGGGLWAVGVTTNKEEEGATMIAFHR
jgi:hypothetical protein